jgi:hypothetical protein
MKSFISLAIFGFLFVAFGGSSALAEIREDGAPASALALGDAVNAIAMGAPALYFNPAGMSRIRSYAIEAGYNYSKDLEGHTFVVSTVDSKTNSWLGMGLGYSYISSLSSGLDRDGHSIRGALSTGYHGKGFSILLGASGRYASLARGEADTEENGGDNDIEYFTMDVGLMATLGNVVSAGVVGRNLIDTTQVVEAPRQVGFGLAGHYKGFQASVDLTLDLQSNPSEEVLLAYAVGAQYLIRNTVVLRLGFSGGGHTDEKKISAGVSYISNLMGVDLSFRHNLDRSVDTMVSLGVKFFLP